MLFGPAETLFDRAGRPGPVLEWRVQRKAQFLALAEEQPAVRDRSARGRWAADRPVAWTP